MGARSIPCFRKDRKERKYGKEISVREWHRRKRIIVRLVKQGKDAAKIGIILGRTRERVRQLMNEIRDVCGADVFDGKKLWTIPEAVALLRRKKINARAGIIHRLCERGEIFSVLDGGKRLLPAQSIEALKRHPRITHRCQCKKCGRRFVCEISPLCRRCRKEAKKKYQRAYLRKPATRELVEGWHKLLYELLQASPPLNGEENWLLPHEAMGIARITYTQLWILRRKRMVKTKPHAHKRWRGKRIRTFAESEMKIVREAHECYG